jgi:hypothetical protein
MSGGWKPPPPPPPPRCPATGPVAPATEQTAQLAVEIAPQFVQVGWTLVGPLAAPFRSAGRRRSSSGRSASGFPLRLVAATPPTRVVQVEHAPDPALASPVRDSGVLVKFHSVRSLFLSVPRLCPIRRRRQKPTNGAICGGICPRRPAASHSASCSRRSRRPSPLRALTKRRTTGTPSTSYSVAHDAKGAVRFQRVDLVEHEHLRNLGRHRSRATRAAHRPSAPGIRVGGVHHMQQQVGFCRFLQRRLERRRSGRAAGRG